MEDKIKKLLILAKGSTSTAEAQAAFGRAAALAAQCGIELDDIELDDQGEVEPEDFGELDSLVLFETGRVVSWRNALTTAVCRVCGCAGRIQRRWIDGERRTLVRIYGRERAIAAAAQLYHALADAIDELSKQFDGRADRNAFRLGAAHGVVAAHEAAIQRLPGTSNLKALALQRSAGARAAEAEEFAGRARKGRRAHCGGTQSAYAAGHEAGRSLDREAPQRARLGAG